MKTLFSCAAVVFGLIGLNTAIPSCMGMCSELVPAVSLAATMVCGAIGGVFHL